MKKLDNKLIIRRAQDRFHSNHGWLNSWHSFSFADHYDPSFMGFEKLRVINEDTVAPQSGFGSHPHRDMEIISYVISGQLEHKDSMGNGRIIHPGEFQYMSAGSGVTHSEFNPSQSEPVHFLQIWITPNEHGSAPRYQEFKTAEHYEELTLIASPDGQENSISIKQEASLYLGQLEAGKQITSNLQPNKTWIQLINGELQLKNETIQQGDGVAIHGSLPTLSAKKQSTFLLFTF